MIKTRVLVCGSRYWKDYRKIYNTLGTLDSKKTIIVHGACKGADQLAGIAAKALGMEVEEYPADWDKYGKAAGPIRNVQMAETGINHGFAFHENYDKSKGTKHMVSELKKRNVPVEIIK